MSSVNTVSRQRQCGNFYIGEGEANGELVASPVNIHSIMTGLMGEEGWDTTEEGGDTTEEGGDTTEFRTKCHLSIFVSLH